MPIDSKQHDTDNNILPRHIAIIMDGNGRWATQRDKARVYGHAKGAEAVKPIIVECARLGIEAVTLYSFSMENWKRPDDEVGSLMMLYAEHLAKERQLIMDNNIRFRHFGRRDDLPDWLLKELDDAQEVSQNNTGMVLALALNYGSRDEITTAVKTISQKVVDGELNVCDISQQTISDHLYTAGIPDPDLLIRTAGEKRISNFLLWQISYAELWVTDDYWPDFTVDHLHDAINDFASRQRRFGAIVSKETSE